MMDDFVKRPRPTMDIKPRGAPQPIARPPAAPAEPEHKPEPSVLPPPEKVEPAKVRAPIFAIIVALMVSAALIGLTIFAYNKNKESDKQTAESTTSTPQVSDQDLDDTSKAIDEGLDSLDDEADFPEADVSDEALGL